MAVAVELARLAQTLEAFTSRPPRELPDGLLDRVTELQEAIKEVVPSTESPGRREARDLAGGGELAEREPVKGTPGTRAASTAQEFSAAAGKLAERVSGTPAE